MSESELNKASKGLHATKGTREHSDSLEYDPAVAEKLQALYEKLNGDIKAIFEVRSCGVHCSSIMNAKLTTCTLLFRSWTRAHARL